MKRTVSSQIISVTKKPTLKRNPKTKNLAKVRNWLAANKVFFDIFQAIGLGVMAIFISINANRISEQEHDLNRIKSMPAFKIVMVPSKTIDSNFYDTYNLEIDNNGERLSRFDCDIYSHLTVKQTCGRCSSTNIFEMPISDWFAGKIYTHNLTGKLLETVSDRNNFYLMRIQNLGVAPKPISEMFYMDFVMYLRLRYRDIEDHDHTEYWLVWFLNSYKISEKDFQKNVAELMHNPNYKEFSLKSLTLDDIRDYSSKLSQRSQ